MFLSDIDWTEIHEEGMELDAFDRFEEDSGLEKCPWCGGVYYNYMGQVVNEEGDYFNDYHDSEPKLKNYHASCWDKRTMAKRNVRQSTIESFSL